MPYPSLHVNERIVTCLLLFTLFSLVGCGGGSPAIPTAVAVPATATSAPLPATPVPAPATSAPAPATSLPVATPAPSGEQVTFQFVAGLSSIEEIDDIDLLLHEVEGILGVKGDEKSITIIYDPELITQDELLLKMEEIGYPVQPPT